MIDTRYKFQTIAPPQLPAKQRIDARSPQNKLIPRFSWLHQQHFLSSARLFVFRSYFKVHRLAFCKNKPRIVNSQPPFITASKIYIIKRKAETGVVAFATVHHVDKVEKNSTQKRNAHLTKRHFNCFVMNVRVLDYLDYDQKLKLNRNCYISVRLSVGSYWTDHCEFDYVKQNFEPLRHIAGSFEFFRCKLCSYSLNYILP